MKRTNGVAHEGPRNKRTKSQEAIHNDFQSRAWLEKQRKDLPIWPKRLDIRWALRNNDVLLLNGATGSGKSTQVPQFLYREPWMERKNVQIKNEHGLTDEVGVGGIIAITQPRRIAATSLAARVGVETGYDSKGNGKNFNGTVGYSVRFDTFAPRNMKIKYVTEGMLLQEMLHDPYLRQYSAVIIDEIHERSMDVDLLAGFLRNLVHGDKKGRGGVPLKLIIMSATLDVSKIEAFFEKPKAQPTLQLVSNESRRSSSDSITSYPSWGGCSDNEKTQTNMSETSPEPDNGIPIVSEHERRTGIPDGDIRPNGVAIEYVEGRQYPVEILYEVSPCTDYMRNILQTVLHLHSSEPFGDKDPGGILVFLTGQDEIEELQKELEKFDGMLVEAKKKTLPRMKILPLYGSLPIEQQQLAFKKDCFVNCTTKSGQDKKVPARKVVLSTNIAETSVTCSGVRYVIDCGKSKVKQYRQKLGLESLLAMPISKVSAIQRAGRAGREGKGKCFRVYTREHYNRMTEKEKPEILRCDVLEAVLKMKARGVDDVLNFPLMDSPDVSSMQRALGELYSMGALDDKGSITEEGKRMACYPLPAAYGRVLISAAESGVLLEAIDVIALLTTDGEIFLQPRMEEDHERVGGLRESLGGPREMAGRGGDILTYLVTMQLFNSPGNKNDIWCRERLINTKAMKTALRIRKQLRDICTAQHLISRDSFPDDGQAYERTSPERAVLLIKAFLKAFTSKTALLAEGGKYVTVMGRNDVQIHPSSVLHGQKNFEAIVFLEHVYTTKSWAKKVAPVQANWIEEAMGI